MRAENMHYNLTTRALFVFDFSHAVVDSLDGQEEFREACGEDDAALNRLIEWSESEEGRRLKYMHVAGAGLSRLSM